MVWLNYYFMERSESSRLSFLWIFHHCGDILGGDDLWLYFLLWHRRRYSLFAFPPLYTSFYKSQASPSPLNGPFSKLRTHRHYGFSF